MRGLVGNISKICLVFVQELFLTFNLCNFALGFLCMFFFFAQTLPPPLSKKQKGHPGIVLRVNLLKYERFVIPQGTSSLNLEILGTRVVVFCQSQ